MGQFFYWTGIDVLWAIFFFWTKVYSCYGSYSFLGQGFKVGFIPLKIFSDQIFSGSSHLLKVSLNLQSIYTHIIYSCVMGQMCSWTGQSYRCVMGHLFFSWSKFSCVMGHDKGLN